MCPNTRPGTAPRSRSLILPQGFERTPAVTPSTPPPSHCTPLALLLARPLAASLQLIGFDIKKNCHEEHFQKMRAKQMGWGGRVLFCNRKRRGGVTSSLLCFSLAFLFIPLSPSLAFWNLRGGFFSPPPLPPHAPAAHRRTV